MNLSDLAGTTSDNPEDFMSYLLTFLQDDALNGADYSSDEALSRIMEAIRASERGESFILRPEDLDSLEGTGSQGALY